jgi:hypothetical protein
MRVWVDKGLEEEHAEGAGSFMLARKIKALEEELAKLQKNSEYVRAKTIKEQGLPYYEKIAKLLDDGEHYLSINYDTRQLALAKWGEEDYVIMSGYPYWTHFSGFNFSSLKDYLAEYNVSRFHDVIPKEVQHEIVARAIEAYPAEVKVFENLNPEIEKLQAELTALKKKAAGQQCDW